MGQFPKCVYAYENYPPGSGMVGFKLFVMTNDGNNYFPTIFEIKEDSYTKKADLKVYDMILAVDGISTLNKSVKDIKALIRGEAGTEILFTIWRTGQKFDVRVKRSQKQ